MNGGQGTNRRALVKLFGLGGCCLTRKIPDLTPIVIQVNAMLDRGAHSGKGLTAGELSKFRDYQETARREYATSGIRFELRIQTEAYLRQQQYSVIPYQFLVLRMINLFVTDTLRYDVDRDRTGGSSTGPRPRAPGFMADPYYKIFLGLREASQTTLLHEYAHHFTLDTQRRPSAAANFWSDFRNDYWLWQQRHGVPIPEFRACAKAEWAKFGRPS